MEITGKIIAALPPQTGTTEHGEWMKASYVIEESNKNYPQKFIFEVRGRERIERLNIRQGQELTVYFSLSCREYQGKYYNTITAYDARPVEQAEPKKPDGEPVEAF